MVDGAATLFAMFCHGAQNDVRGPRGTNLLDTGAPTPRHCQRIQAQASQRARMGTANIPSPKLAVVSPS